VGNTPPILQELNDIEVAILSPNRIMTQAIVLRASHQGIHGWHSLFENDVGRNLGTLNALINAGLEREIICVLCGAFTKFQFDKVKKTYQIRPDKILSAFRWLKENNHYYADMEMPNISAIRQPIILKDPKSYTDANGTWDEADISNSLNVTFIFPDADVITPATGKSDARNTK